MQLKALFTMIILVSISWGGFFYCLYLAIKKEALKTKSTFKK